MNNKPSFGKNKSNLSEGDQEQIEIRRTKLPRDNQVIGILESRLGGSRMKVRGMDGKTRVCRVPGRLKRKLWVREGDVLLIEPWEFGGDDKGDVIFKYRPSQVSWLKKNGYLKQLEVEEF
ncbi:MAG: translation initiation factor eIF-1A [Nanoarchaeota archaeon]